MIDVTGRCRCACCDAGQCGCVGFLPALRCDCTPCVVAVAGRPFTGASPSAAAYAAAPLDASGVPFSAGTHAQSAQDTAEDTAQTDWWPHKGPFTVNRGGIHFDPHMERPRPPSREDGAESPNDEHPAHSQQHTHEPTDHAPRTGPQTP